MSMYFVAAHTIFLYLLLLYTFINILDILEKDSNGMIFNHNYSEPSGK